MTLNEAIKYCEDFAMQKEEYASIAEWLKELNEVYKMMDGCSDYDELFVGYIRNRMKGKQFYPKGEFDYE